MELLKIWVDPQFETLLEDWLWSFDALSVGSLPPSTEERRLDALFQAPDRSAIEASLADWVARMSAPKPKTQWELIEEQQWQVAWRENFEPLKVGQFLLIGEWEEQPAHPESRVIRIYPGQAFGTGQHATTQLMIEHLETMDLQGKRVLDVGCGTGILALAAERLGAREVLGFDIDPDCRENMVRHLKINGSQRVSLQIGTLEQIPVQAFDVVLANITLNVLREVWPQIGAYLAENAVVLSTGILDEQEPAARERLTELGFQVTHQAVKDEWVLLSARRS